MAKSINEDSQTDSMMRNPGFDVRHYFLRKQILAKQCRLNAAFIRYLIRKVLFMGSPVIRAHCTSCIAAAICAFWLTSACCQEAAKQPKLNSEVERCRRIINEHMRTHCLEQINAKAAPVPQNNSPPLLVGNLRAHPIHRADLIRFRLRKLQTQTHRRRTLLD